MENFDWSMVCRARTIRAGQKHTAAEREIASTRPIQRVGALVLVFGVVLPLFTLLFEIISGFCAALAFDPIPTIRHMFLTASVPIINAWSFAALRGAHTRHIKTLIRWNAFVIGVGLYYSLVFLPLMPIGILALIAAGTGLMPLSPGLALVITLILRKRLRQLSLRTSNAPLPRGWPATVLAIALLLLLSAPKILTFTGARLALQKTQEPAGVRFLRTYGNRTELLKLCFRVDRPLAPLRLFDGFLSVLGLTMPGIREIEPEQGQRLYYRVTGTPYNAVRPPEMRGLRGNSIGGIINGSEFDFDQGGDAVAARIRGLELDRSQMEASIDAETAIAYLEWTLVFRNDSRVQREARAQLLLPPGSVVSRLTLWINEEEREAAYSERNQVKKAYKTIVQRQRDPVLATTSGKNSILLQCFPVPPHGGIMQTRVGITVPLTLESETHALLRLPCFIERNFGLFRRGTHTLKASANAELKWIRPPAEFPESGLSPQLQGELSSDNIIRPTSIQVARASHAGFAWTEDYRSDRGHIILQESVETRADLPAQIVVVLDGSRHMDKHKEALARFMSELPLDLGLTVLMASDEVAPLCAFEKLSQKNREEIGTWLREAIFEGGCDNIPALRKALEIAAVTPRTTVIWLHAAQPVPLSDTPLWSDKDNSIQVLKLYDLQLEAGPHVATPKWTSLSCIETVPSFGDASRDLIRLGAVLDGTAVRHEWRRSRVLPSSGNLRGKQASPHLARLWANDEIHRLIESGRDEDLTNAVGLATSYQIVTPVSGAVVLETKEQYEESGLIPANPDSMPGVAIVPEPETWALMMVGTMALFLVRARWRKHV